MKKAMIKYLKEKGWIIKNDHAYLKKDKNFEMPYSIEGTYSLYVDGVYSDDIRGDN